MQAYTFTSTPIAKALVDAHKRGVKIEVILDKSQRTEKYSSRPTSWSTWASPRKIDAKHAIAHNKIMVIDGQTVITGSFNFTTAAEEHNAENLLVIRSPDLAAKYTANWKVHADHSDAYAGRTEGYSQTHRAESAACRPATPPCGRGLRRIEDSQVFHRADCKSAAKISEKNLVRTPARRSDPGREETVCRVPTIE